MRFAHGVQLMVEVKGSVDMWGKAEPPIEKIKRSGWEGAYLVVGWNIDTINTIDADAIKGSTTPIVNPSKLAIGRIGRHGIGGTENDTIVIIVNP